MRASSHALTAGTCVLFLPRCEATAPRSGWQSHGSHRNGRRWQSHPRRIRSGGTGGRATHLSPARRVDLPQVKEVQLATTARCALVPPFQTQGHRKRRMATRGWKWHMGGAMDSDRKTKRRKKGIFHEIKQGEGGGEERGRLDTHLIAAEMNHVVGEEARRGTGRRRLAASHFAQQIGDEVERCVGRDVEGSVARR